MKKNKNIFLIVIGFIIAGVVGVKASSLISSSQVIYKDNKTVDAALNNLFDELKVGKEKIAEAITNKGIQTNVDDSLENMATNIGNISSSDENLRFNEELGYIQVKNDSGDWVNIYGAEQLPIPTILYFIKDSFSQDGASWTPVYTTQESASYLNFNNNKITIFAGTSSSNAKWVKGYLNGTKTFRGTGQKVYLTTQYAISDGDQYPGSNSKQAILYVRNVETGARVSLGSILGTNTHTFTLPSDGAEYVFDIWCQLYSYTSYSSLTVTLTISNFYIA